MKDDDPIEVTEVMAEKVEAGGGAGPWDRLDPGPEIDEALFRARVVRQDLRDASRAARRLVRRQIALQEQIRAARADPARVAATPGCLPGLARKARRINRARRALRDDVRETELFRIEVDVALEDIDACLRALRRELGSAPSADDADGLEDLEQDHALLLGRRCRLDDDLAAVREHLADLRRGQTGLKEGLHALRAASAGG